MRRDKKHISSSHLFGHYLLLPTSLTALSSELESSLHIGKPEFEEPRTTRHITSVQKTFDDRYGRTIRTGMQRIQRQEWWLWSSAAVITLLLTLGLVSFTIAWLHSTKMEIGNIEISPTPRGLVGLVFLFYVYVVYQQLQIHRIRRRLLQREEVFRLITEHAADMIAVVDENGRRIYNSPSYERILGYSIDELQKTDASDEYIRTTCL